MTKKPKKKIAKPPKAEKAARREVRESPGLGHNIAAIRDQGAPYVERYLKLTDAMDSDMAGYRSDINNLYEEASGDLGMKKTVISKELKRIRANQKAAAKEKEMAADEREQTEMWRAAMVGTQFEIFSAGDLAQPESSGNAAESDEEGSKD